MFQLSQGIGIRSSTPNMVDMQNNYEFTKVGKLLTTNVDNIFGPYGSVSIGEHFEQCSEAAIKFSDLVAPLDYTMISPQFSANGLNFKGPNRVFQGFNIVGGVGHAQLYGHSSSDFSAKFKTFSIYADSFPGLARTRFEQTIDNESSSVVFDWWSGMTNTGGRIFQFHKGTAGVDSVGLYFDMAGDFHYDPTGAASFRLATDFIMTNGIVGIGTITPTNHLQINKDAATLHLKDTQNRDDWGHGTVLDEVRFSTSDGTGNGPGPVGKIAAVNRLGVTAPFVDLWFWANGAQRTFADPDMVIDGVNHYVGIGQTNPGTKLEVMGPIRITDPRNDDAWTNGVTLSGLEFYTPDTSGTGPGIGAAIRPYNDQGSVAPFIGLSFLVGGAGRNPVVQAMNLSGLTGFLGIGITNPVTALDINGNIRANGITNSGATANRIAVFDANKGLVSGNATVVEGGYLNGVTGPIQAQIDGKQPLDSDLTAVAGLSGTGIIVRTGVGTALNRTIFGDSEIVVTNGDGVSGHPTRCHRIKHRSRL